MQRALASTTTSENVHFYSSSGGNAGLACVHAARFLSRPATVVVPLSTQPMMLAKIRAAGASQVLQHGATWREADAFLREQVIVAAEQRGETGVYVPPFDHPDIWAGHATMVMEMQTQLRDPIRGDAQPDVLVCSVGGGGLFNGIMEGVEKAGWSGTTVLAVETKGADSLNTSLRAGELVTLPAITSKATTLGATKVSSRTFELASTSKQVKSAVLSDAEAAMGCWRLADDERLMVELSCGVNVALCYGGRLERALNRPVRQDEKVVIVLCGGCGVTVDMLAEYKQEFGTLQDTVEKEEMDLVASAASLTNGV